MVGIFPTALGCLLVVVVLWFVPLPGSPRGLAPRTGRATVLVDVLVMLVGAACGLVVGLFAPVAVLVMLGRGSVSYEEVLLTCLVAMCILAVGLAIFALRVRRWLA